MPANAVDVLGPAFQHTKRQLLRPFRAGQWAKLALVGLLAGEVSSGGCNGNFQFPHNNTGTHHFVAAFPTSNPMVYASLIALLIVLGTVVGIIFLYIGSVMRFILFDSVVQQTCEVRNGWGRRQGPGLRYFVWRILFILATFMGMTILVGIPAAVAFAAGWLKEPRQHLVPLILGGIVLFFVVLACFCLVLAVHVLTKDFVVPQMALENISAFEGWRRFWPMMKAEKGGYAGYLGLKIVMTLGAAIVVGIVATILILVLLIPIGGAGVLLVLAGKTGGLSWNAYTITFAVVAGCILLAIFLYLVALISVPVIVFFPAYSIYFFAERYPALRQVVFPAPPAAPISPSPPSPPPLPPDEEPAGA